MKKIIAIITKIVATVKSIVAIVKKALGLVKTITPEQKKEAETIVKDVIKAVEEVKVKQAEVPVAPKGNLIPLESAPAAPKKKKKYYKPKAKSNSL